jgi:hypothetical protein
MPPRNWRSPPFQRRVSAFRPDQTRDSNAVLIEPGTHSAKCDPDSKLLRGDRTVEVFQGGNCWVGVSRREDQLRRGSV